jgi:hypothetical protein
LLNLYVIRRRKVWKTAAELEAAASRSARIGNEEMADQVPPVLRTVVVREDPAEA